MQLDPKCLPDLPAIRLRAKALAMLDAIVSPEWEYRYYSFDAAWGDGEEMASMRNGEGDDWFLLFCRYGAAIKGLNHESPIATNDTFAKEIMKSVPDTFASFLNEPAFSMDRATFCYWRNADNEVWSKVIHPNSSLANADDGSSLLALLLEPPTAYQDFANEYFECQLPLDAIEHVYANSPLTKDIVKRLNSNLTLAEADQSAAEIGYAVAEGHR
jgi:hypothetical protein